MLQQEACLIDSISFRSECKQKLVLFGLIDRYKKIDDFAESHKKNIVYFVGFSYSQV